MNAAGQIPTQDLLRYARLCDRVYSSVFNHKSLGYRTQKMVHDPWSRAYARVLAGKREVVVVFRGTRDHVLDWPINLRILRRAVLVGEKWVGVHSGFWSLLDGNDAKRNQSGYTVLMGLLERHLHRGLPWIFTGHSLGGALAVLSAARVEAEHPGRIHRVVTFGQPAVGGEEFKTAYPLNEKTACFFGGGDLLTFLPGPFYSHVGTQYWLHNGNVFKNIPWPIRLIEAVKNGSFWAIRRGHSMKTYIDQSSLLLRDEMQQARTHGSSHQH